MTGRFAELATNACIHLVIYTYRKIVPVVRLGWLAPARQLIADLTSPRASKESDNVKPDWTGLDCTASVLYMMQRERKWDV